MWKTISWKAEDHMYIKRPKSPTHVASDVTIAFLLRHNVPSLELFRLHYFVAHVCEAICTHLWCPHWIEQVTQNGVCPHHEYSFCQQTPP